MKEIFLPQEKISCENIKIMLLSPPSTPAERGGVNKNWTIFWSIFASFKAILSPFSFFHKKTLKSCHPRGAGGVPKNIVHPKSYFFVWLISYNPQQISEFYNNPFWKK